MLSSSEVDVVGWTMRIMGSLVIAGKVIARIAFIEFREIEFSTSAIEGLITVSKGMLGTSAARERQRIEEQEHLKREAAETERKRKEEEEARERAAHEAAEREAALVKMRQEKLLSLGPEPEKGPDVTQVLVRFPSGERKERRFHCTATSQSLHDYVDSLGCLAVVKFQRLY
ncbi:Plant UBX domain-containing protein 10 [Capsicum chinense]|nr:Plant UBX domain-containing protein 10 [Capsicum chinense]